MAAQNPVRIGVVGIGGMGSYHASYLRQGKIRRAVLAAVCDINKEKLAAVTDVPTFTDSAALIRSGKVDAVLVATPHYFHTTIGIDALQEGLHVLVEKPVSVHKADAERLLAAHRNPKQRFAAMFNQRTNPLYIKLRQLVQGNELGEIRRVSWIVTDWFRSQAYYDSGGWRATWGGEGGGVLLNQCPHNLDLLQWITGMPSKVRAFCGFGRFHAIEVEDQVTAYLEYPNGATGVFITTTGEAPGTNRFEIAAELGKVVVEHGRIQWTRNEVAMGAFSKTSKSGFGAPPVWNVEIPVAPCPPQHETITQNFVDAIVDGTPLIAPAAEGIHSVELANAMLFSTFTDATIQLPLAAAAYEKQLKKLIANSKTAKKSAKGGSRADMAASFQKP